MPQHLQYKITCVTQKPPAKQKGSFIAQIDINDPSGG